MILRLSSSAQRRALVLVAFLVAVFLSYFSIRNARADHFAGLQTLPALERATQLEPGDARNWYLLGRYWQFNLEDSDAQKALRAYKIAVSVDPRSAVSWLGLGLAYESAGDLVHARDAFLQAKKAYPLSAEVAWQFGNFLLRQGELESAFAEMRRAVESDPRRGAEAFSRAFHVEPDVERILNRALPPIRDVTLSKSGTASPPFIPLCKSRMHSRCSAPCTHKSVLPKQAASGARPHSLQAWPISKARATPSYGTAVSNPEFLAAAFPGFFPIPSAPCKSARTRRKSTPELAPFA